MPQQKRFDLVVLILWPIAAALASLFLQANFFYAIILFFLAPSIYLSYRHPKFIRKSLIVSFVPIPFLVVVEWIAGATGQWIFPISVFSSRLFGFVPFDVFLWYFVWIFYIVMFYEYFIDEHCRRIFSSRRLKYAFIAFLCIFCYFLLQLFVTGTFIKVPYFYLWWGIIFGIIPIIIFLFRFPNLVGKLTQATIYFSFVSFLWEMVALRLNHWQFPGPNFIGWVEVGGVRFPFEEFLVWIIQGAAAILVWYEFFDDDRK